MSSDASSSSPSPNPDDPDIDRSDCFAPPEQACECYCLHCQRIFMSDGIWFQKVINARDGFKGFWMCPTPNCDGAGFTFDIFPTDPNHPANEGWHDSDDEEDDGEQEYDPSESKYSEFEEEFEEEQDDDLEGEEWKHGLQPGERPPEPAWVADARKHWEDEQAKYSGPDERPRVQDWANHPEPPPSTMGESDIPF